MGNTNNKILISTDDVMQCRNSSQKMENLLKQYERNILKHKHNHKHTHNVQIIDDDTTATTNREEEEQYQQKKLYYTNQHNSVERCVCLLEGHIQKRSDRILNELVREEEKDEEKKQGQKGVHQQSLLRTKKNNGQTKNN